MKKSIQFKAVRVGIGAILCFFAFTSLGAAAEFSAEFVVKAQGEADMVGKIYVKGQKVRQELTEEGETQIVILRPDQGVTWMVTPEEKIYMEIPYQSEGASFEEWTPEKEKGAKYIGEDTVSGVASKKYEIVEDGEKTTFWISKKHSFPVKIEDPEATIEYRNIKDGSVSDSIFDVPAGYEKMTVPMMPMEQGAPKE